MGERGGVKMTNMTNISNGVNYAVKKKNLIIKSGIQ